MTVQHEVDVVRKTVGEPVRLFFRDLAVVCLGAAMVFVANGLTGLVPNETYGALVGAAVAILKLHGYRLLRESGMLNKLGIGPKYNS